MWSNGHLVGPAAHPPGPLLCGKGQLAEGWELCAATRLHPKRARPGGTPLCPRVAARSTDNVTMSSPRPPAQPGQGNRDSGPPGLVAVLPQPTCLRPTCVPGTACTVPILSPSCSGTSEGPCHQRRCRQCGSGKQADALGQRETSSPEHRGGALPLQVTGETPELQKGKQRRRKEGKPDDRLL